MDLVRLWRLKSTKQQGKVDFIGRPIRCLIAGMFVFQGKQKGREIDLAIRCAHMTEERFGLTLLARILLF